MAVATTDGSASVPRYGVLGLPLGAAGTLLAGLPGTGLFALGGVFGPLSDLAALLASVFLVPAAWTLYRLDRPAAPLGAALAAALALLGLGLVAVGSGGLLLRALGVVPGDGLPFLAAQFAGYGVQGLWLVVAGVTARRTGSWPRRVATTAVVAGLAYLSYPAGVVAVGVASPLLSVGVVVAAVGFVARAVTLARYLRRSPPGAA